MAGDWGYSTRLSDTNKGCWVVREPRRHDVELPQQRRYKIGTGAWPWEESHWAVQKHKEVVKLVFHTTAVF